MADRPVVVTGSSGMIGTALVSSLLAAGVDVVGVDRRRNQWDDAVAACTVAVDLTDRTAIDRLPENPAMVVHLAANPRVHDLVQRPLLAAENLETTVTALEYARQGNANVLFASSREVYGNGVSPTAGESDVSLAACESPYSASKLGGEALLRSYCNCYGLDGCVVRLSNVYGRYDASDRVIPLFIARTVSDRDLVVYGREKRLDFTHLDDCIAGLRLALQNGIASSCPTYNIASGSGISLIGVAELIQERLGSGGDVVVSDSRTGEVRQFVANVDRARRELGYEPRVGIDDGLDRTIEWYTQHPELLQSLVADPAPATER